MNRMYAIAAAVLVCAAGWANAQSRQVEATGKVSEVTLYRGQAQIVRQVPVAGPSGSVELVVTGLPNYVQPSSIYGEGSDGVEVRAVRYRTRVLGQAPVKEIAELDEKITALGDELAMVEQSKSVLSRRTKYLDKLEAFVAPTAQVEMSKGVLDAKSLAEITSMTFDQREAIAKRTIELRKQERTLKEEMQLLQRKRSQTASGHSRTAHEAVVFVEKTGNGNASVKLNYLVSNCGWSPAYNFRADSAKQTIGIEYNALIRQMSGEDWSGVKLTLSTATPQLSAAAPTLAPFRVMLARGADPNRKVSEAQLRSQLRQIKGRQITNFNQQRANVQMDDNVTAQWQLNVGANDYQLLELGNGEKKLRVLQDEGGVASDGPSLTYQLENTVSLASRRDQQMVRITRQTLKGTFYHTATPVFSPHVFREAQLPNSTDLDLLSGQVNMYLDGRFVGRMEIPTVARGQTFVVGFGADPQLKATRELVNREEAIQGGNQVVTFDYRLTIENYRDAKMPMRLFDRLPFTDDNKDMRVTLADPKDKLSEDEVYLRLSRPKGILRWDIDVPANASGAKARMVDFNYKLEFARDYYLANPLAPSGGQGGPQPALEQEFRDMYKQKLSN